jgi:hypothetical protein
MLYISRFFITWCWCGFCLLHVVHSLYGSGIQRRTSDKLIYPAPMWKKRVPQPIPWIITFNKNIQYFPCCMKIFPTLYPQFVYQAKKLFWNKYIHTFKKEYLSGEKVGNGLEENKTVKTKSLFIVSLDGPIPTHASLEKVVTCYR